MSKGMSIGDFNLVHDKSVFVPKRIKEALAKLGDRVMYEADFIRLAGLSNTDFARFRAPFVDDHCVETTGRNPKRVWCATKKIAEACRESVSR